MNIEQIKQSLSEYGYSLSDENEIVSPKGKNIGVCITIKKDRLQCRSKALGSLLWSGVSVGDFLESFYYAEVNGRPLHVVSI